MSPQNKKRKKKSDNGIGWKANSADGKKLEKMLLDGEISPGLPPKVVRELHPEFKKYDAAKFRSGLQRMKMKLGVNVRPVAMAMGK